MLRHLPNPGKQARFAVAVSLLCVPVAAFAGADEELAEAAKSPYDIARFVDAHITFGWEPLWKALGIRDSDVLMQPCGEIGGPKRDCFEELVTVLDPFQVIVILRHNLAMPGVYLRFLRSSGPDSSGPWKFGGSYSPLVKYFEPRHRTLRFGEKPFLVITRQGISGSDWSSEIDDWIDLTSSRFEPVLCLNTHGHYSGMADRIGIESEAFAVSMETDLSNVLRLPMTHVSRWPGKPWRTGPTLPCTSDENRRFPLTQLVQRHPAQTSIIFTTSIPITQRTRNTCDTFSPSLGRLPRAPTVNSGGG
jgi:hypothetical protein